jgi:hypothetical protein
MNKPYSIIAAIATILPMLLFSAAVNAQATRTWVSGVGDDVNPCSRTAPCKTFAGAISKTAKDGEISVLDPGGFGTINITKSITINGTSGAGFGSILSSGGVNGVIINITDVNDVRKTVRLNNLDINGASTGNHGIRILAGAAVFVENTNIDGFAGRGISDERTSAGELFVSNTAIRNTVGGGIIVIGPGTMKTTLDNVRVLNSGGYGTVFSTGSRATINRSTFSGNTNAGIYAQSGGEVNVASTVSANNGLGVQAVDGAVARLSNSDVFGNGIGLDGTISSHGNNRISGNTAPGIVPTLLVPALQ